MTVYTDNTIRLILEELCANTTNIHPELTSFENVNLFTRKEFAAAVRLFDSGIGRCPKI
jgi:hypothetical protein